jgi:hypothetical protein
MTATGTEAVTQRLTGGQVSRPRALFTSMLAGVVVTTLTYRWLRSGDDS